MRAQAERRDRCKEKTRKFAMEKHDPPLQG
jgi:hypothetical protein